jgi:hypothetical protein
MQSGARLINPNRGFKEGVVIDLSDIITEALLEMHFFRVLSLPRRQKLKHTPLFCIYLFCIYLDSLFFAIYNASL